MAQYYKFFNSTDTDRRTYQAGDFADYFGSVLSTGLIHTDEVPGMETFVEGGTLRTYVTPGKAIMQGHLYENTTGEYLEHSLPESSADRIDRIVLRLDLRNSERNILLHIKEGDPNSNPVAPSLQRDNFIYELSLAQVRVRANTSSLEASDLVDERLDEGLCGLVNSMLTVPTSQFLSEWNTFMDTIRDQSPASQGDLDNLEGELASLIAGGQVYEAVLQNGWTGNIYYMKNTMGLVFTWGAVDVGETQSGSTVVTLPEEFRPKMHHSFLAYNTSTLRANGGLFISRSSNNLLFRGPAAAEWETGQTIYFNTVYYAE